MVANTAFSFSTSCLYCGAENSSEEHRCTRCGRRLHPANPRPAPDGYRPTLVVNNSTGPAAAAAPAKAPQRPARQPALFGTALLGTEDQRVVPISGPALPPAPTSSKPPDKPKARIVARKAWPGETQQQLAFGPIVSVSRGPATEIESDIHTGACVAATQHRALAAFVDGGIMLFAYVILAGMYVFWGNGRLTGDPVTLGVGGILALLVVLLYQTLWALGNGDSAGMRFARLKLVNFDGRRPKRRERFCRMASAWLSVAPAGLGLVWALLDEEALTWHDQISKTFPSPLDALKSAS